MKSVKLHYSLQGETRGDSTTFVTAAGETAGPVCTGLEIDSFVCSLVPSPSHPSFWRKNCFFSTAARQKLGWEGLGTRLLSMCMCVGGGRGRGRGGEGRGGERGRGMYQISYQHCSLVRGAWIIRELLIWSRVYSSWNWEYLAGRRGWSTMHTVLSMAGHGMGTLGP